MKKITKAPRRTLTQPDLAAVRGGTNGTIIVESIATPEHGPMHSA